MDEGKGRKAQLAELTGELTVMVEELLREVRGPGTAGITDQRADLSVYGLDSLTRIELLSRVETHFEVRLPENEAVGVESIEGLAELVYAALAGDSDEPPDRAAGPLPASHPESAAGEPVSARTLNEAFLWHARQTPERIHVYFEDESEHLTQITYGALHQAALRVAYGLRQRGVKSGERAAIMLPTGPAFLSAFTGCLLAGIIPVPLYPPFQRAQFEEHLKRQKTTLANSGARALITTTQIKPIARLLQLSLPMLAHLLSPDELEEDGTPAGEHNARPEDTAFLQYTSGSTASPKGVILAHRNLLANIRAMGKAINVARTDSFASWLPLYHDMGLIGAWLGSMYFGLPLALISPASFITHPERWLKLITRYRATISGGPNFAYQLCAGRLEDEKLQGVDLSSWRIAFNGAEPVSAETIRQFCSRFSPCGFREEAMLPVYGLAENSVGLCFPAPGGGPRIQNISRTIMQQDHRADPVPEGTKDSLLTVCCGRALPDHYIRVVDSAGNELPERRVGQLQFQGPSSTSGYFENRSATEKLFDGKWLNTGDYGYLDGGEVFVTGRIKDMIIRAGRNIYPQEIEERVGALPGVRKGCVAAFAAWDNKSATEKLVVAAETREQNSAALEEVRRRIMSAAAELAELPPDDVVLLPPRSLPKTSSGKIRRSGARELYEKGELGRRRAAWLQITGLFASAARDQAALLAARFGASAYAVWAYTVLIFFGSAAVLSLALLPGLKLRRSALRLVAQAAFASAGIRIRTAGMEDVLVPRPIIIAANHSSYADALALTAVIPPVFTFVAKKEFTKNAITHFLFARMGAVFVERFDASQSIEDTSEVARRVKSGVSLVVFPEGTFVDRSGLLPFKLGAFSVAAQTQTPVIPLGICGTRRVLRPEHWLPRRAPISIRAGKPIKAPGSTWQDVLELRDQVFAEVARLSEQEPQR